MSNIDGLVIDAVRPKGRYICVTFGEPGFRVTYLDVRSSCLVDHIVKLSSCLVVRRIV